MKPAHNRFANYVVSTLLAVAAWPSLAFIPAYPPDTRLLGFISSNNLLTVAHSDPQGSVIALTGINGILFHTASYGPHGEDWGTQGYNHTPFGWLGDHGVQTLESGTPLRLYLTRHRVYSATLNRFLSPDPLGLAGGLNLYAYGEGNPLMYIDPLGLCAKNVSMSGGFGQYMSDFGQMLLGYGDVVANTVNGLIGIVMSPSQSAMGAMNALSRPDLILENLWDNITDAWNSGYRGQGQVFGNALITAATVAAPFASGGSAAAAGTGAATTKLLPAPSGPNPWAGNITSTVTTQPLAVERFGGAIKSPWVQLQGVGGTPATLSISPGNPANIISSSVIPVGTRIQQGIAAPVPSWGGVGGAHQIQILDYNVWNFEMIWTVMPR